MKKIWVNVDKWDPDLVTVAIDGGANALVVPDGCAKLVSELGKINVISKDGDLVPGLHVVFCRFSCKDDLDEIIRISMTKIVVLECDDWKIIPLENIIAKKSNNIILSVKNFREALLVFEILEKGVLGVLVDSKDVFELKRILSEFYNYESGIELRTGLIELVKSVGVGDRVCIDICSCMDYGEGILVGNSSSFLFLVHAENVENFYIDKRPFRVNAGAIHSYVFISDRKTNYLSEMSSGSNIQIVNFNGGVESVTVGRIKIEKRPLLFIKAVCDGYIGSVILQNAETIKFVLSDGGFRSVLDIESGDKILVHMERGARHFGYKVEEYIVEK